MRRLPQYGRQARSASPAARRPSSTAAFGSGADGCSPEQRRDAASVERLVPVAAGALRQGDGLKGQGDWHPAEKELSNQSRNVRFRLHPRLDALLYAKPPRGCGAGFQCGRARCPALARSTRPRTILPSSAATASSPSASIRTGKEHPVLVDLETLFHPEEAEPVSREEGEVPSWMTPNHVMATGLLPSSGESGPDVGGIGGGPGQKAAKPATVVDNPGADQMRIQRREIELLPADNRPEYIDGRKVDPGGHVRDVEAGFVRVYRERYSRVGTSF